MRAVEIISASCYAGTYWVLLACFWTMDGNGSKMNNQNDPKNIVPERVTSEKVVEAPQTHLSLDRAFVRRLTKTDTTPSVRNTELCLTQNTGAVTVTDFLDGAEGQHLYILGDGHTTVADNTKIFTNTGANKLLAADLFYHFIRFNGVWVEIEDLNSGGGGGGGVTSFNGRTGAVVPAAGDYDAFYYTESEVDTALAGKSSVGHTHAASDIVSGTMAQARLGSGSGGTGAKFLADDQTYKTVGSVAAGSFMAANRPFVYFYRSASAGFTMLGGISTSNGTISTPAIADTDNMTRTVRLRFTGTTGTGQIVGPRSNETLFMTKTGFKFRAVFGQESNINDSRAIIGLVSTTTPIATGDPSAQTDIIGIGWDQADSSSGNWYIIRNDGTGTATKVDTGQARDTSLLRLEMDSDDGTSITVKLYNLNTGSLVYSNTFSTDLPTTTTAMRVHLQLRNEVTAGGTAPILSMAMCYCEHGPTV